MAEGLTQTLPGTHKAALEFRDWLMAHQGVAPADIYLCAEDAALAGRTAGAKRDDIAGELQRLKNEGKDKTDELYFLFIGHGLCYKDIDGVRLADIMLAADYKNRSISGNACLKIDEIQKWLRLCMGPSDHFYFIDACRNDTSERDIKVGALGLTYDNSRLGIPTVYTLYSTVEGAVAVANSGFVQVLIAALKGFGRAKVWRGADMAVFFRSVKDYVEKKLAGQSIDERKEGSRDGLIREIAPPPAFKCEVVVQNAAPSDQFILTVSDARGSHVAITQFAGPIGSFTRVPDDYNLQLSSPATLVDPIDPLPADLYDDCRVRFVMRAPVLIPTPGAFPPGGLVDVTVHAPAGAKIVLRHLNRDETVEGTETFSERLMPGRYLVDTVDSRGVGIRQQIVEITAAQPLELDLRKFDSSPLRDALLRGIPGVHYGGAVDMSESLGPTPDQGLDLWLAVIGASRIIGGPGEFSKLGPLPLTSFADTAPNESKLYLLAGFDEAQTRLRVGLSAGPHVTLHPLDPHPNFPGLFEFAHQVKPGYWLISMQIDEKASVSVGACTLANRATLVTLTTNHDGALRVQQFILPIKRLAKWLSPREREYFVHKTPLLSVKRMVEIQRQFARSEEFKTLLSREELNSLLYVKWLEPIVAVLAAYELTRRSELQHMREVVRNLRRFFAEIPDTEAIAKMAGLDWRMPPHPPLVLDGFLSLNMPSRLLPLDSEMLDFRGPWTEWKGAASATQTTPLPPTSRQDRRRLHQRS
jgi:hypothetical protein